MTCSFTTTKAMALMKEGQSSGKLLPICVGTYNHQLEHPTGTASASGARAEPSELPDVPLLWSQPALGTAGRRCCWLLLPVEDPNSAFWVLRWCFSAKLSQLSLKAIVSVFSSKQGNDQTAWSHSTAKYRVQLEAVKPSLCRIKGSKWSKLLVKTFVKPLGFLKFPTKSKKKKSIVISAVQFGFQNLSCY